MRTLLFASALAVVLSVGAVSVMAQTAAPAPAAAGAPEVWKYKTHKLDRAKIDALLAKPSKVVVLDVRRPDELTTIGGFPVYLSIQIKDLPNQLAYIPKDRQIITVSNRAHRAGDAGDLLTSKGFKVAGAAGVLDYQDQGGTLVKIAPPAPKAP